MLQLEVHRAGEAVSLQVEGGRVPFRVDWGDGAIDVKRSRLFGHTYRGGAERIRVQDGSGLAEEVAL